MKTILVTGGAGFIGSHVAKKLIEQGDKVVIVDNFNTYYNPRLKQARIDVLLKGLDFELYKNNIVDFKGLKEIFAKHNFNKVVHLAAQAGVRYSLEHPEAYGDTNLTGTLNLLRLSADNKVKNFIFASSSSVYGLNKNFPSKETEKVDTPLSLYAATKIAGESLCHVYAKTNGLQVAVLRFFNVYGPWMRPDMALYKFAKRIISGEPLDVYNFGKSSKDYTYIDDIVSGVVAAVNKDFDYEIVNLGNKHPIELHKYIELIEKQLGKKANQKLLPPIPGDVQESCADITKAKKLLGYQPKISVEEGIKRFIEWYQRYRDQLDLDSISM